MLEKRVIPTLHVVANSIPEAHYKATKAVYEDGMDIRTQYDRKENGVFIDPPGKDAKVLIEVANPFNQPRYPALSFSEIGTYIAEIMGAKDHKVIPYNQLKQMIASNNVGTQWPYSYHQRLFTYPLADGSTLNQVDVMLNTLARSLISRRAVANTNLPEIDCYLPEDIPCLREIQLRCTEADGQLYLHMDTKWRSRDLFKAWHDNVIALTFLQGALAKQLGEKIGREVKVGSYSDYSSSLHIYGQDLARWNVKQGYIDRGAEAMLKRAMTSEKAQENLVVPQLENLLQQAEKENYPENNKQIIRGLISDLKEGRAIA